MTILLTKGPWFGFGFHRCLYIQGCFATGEAITETPSKGILLFDWRVEHLTLTLGQTNAFKQYLARWDFPCSFLSVLSDDSIIWLHGWALLPLPCYGERWSTNMLRSHALLGKARRAIQLREHPGDHKWYHIEVPVGVPSVSTQCLGLLRVLEPSRCGTPLWVPLC